MIVKSLMDLMFIDQEDLPLLVLSDNIRSWVSARIKSHEHGSYNHFMWMIRPTYFATQNWMFTEQPVEDYLVGYRIKLWHNPLWSKVQRGTMIAEVRKRLAMPWHKRLYDPLQILGIRFGLNWLQIPGNSRICSDHVDVIKAIDPRFDMPVGSSPSDINRYLANHQDYEVYGRYGDD